MVDLSKEKEALRDNQNGSERVSVPEEVVSVEAGKRAAEQAKDNLEVASWMEKIEKKFGRVPNATSDITDDMVVVQQPQAQQPPVTLPINAKQMAQGKKAKPDLGIAWLVTWVVRQIKMITRLGGKVRLQDIPEVK